MGDDSVGSQYRAKPVFYFYFFAGAVIRAAPVCLACGVRPAPPAGGRPDSTVAQGGAGDAAAPAC